MARLGFEISAAIIRKGAHILDHNLNAELRRKAGWLPGALQRAAINVDRLNVLRGANVDLQQRLSAMPEGVPHLVLEVGDKFHVLGLDKLNQEELQRLEEEGLDAQGMISQLGA